MNILIIKHAYTEGPGTLGDYFRERGARVAAVDLQAGGKLPADPRAFDAVVSMGGPMNVYQDGRYPFLREETAFLQEALAGDVPLLGICLGAQMLARAAYARVGPSPVREVGWSTVELTPEGKRDPVLGGLPDRIPVLQWHEDAFDIPDGGVLLATGSGCRHQAFRFRSAWGFQFHVEVDRDMLEAWFEGDERRSEVLGTYHGFRGRFQSCAVRIYANLAAFIRQRAFFGRAVPGAGSV